VALRRTTKIKRALKKLLLTPMPPVWPATLWERSPSNLRLWFYAAAIVVATAIRFPFVALAILASVLCGAVIALFLGRSNPRSPGIITSEPSQNSRTKNRCT
jgi:hypothetical protein